MRKTKQLLLSFLALAGLVTLPANADLNQKQVGTPNNSTTSSNFPVYTMNKYCEGINIYQQGAIGLDSGVKIKELSFTGYQTSEKNFENATMTVYLANTNSTNYTDFLKDGTVASGAAATFLDTDKATLFYEGPYEQAMGGSNSAPIQVFKVTSEEGFEYGGENLMVYIYISTPKGGPYTTFTLATSQGNTYKNFGAYRSQNYTLEQYNGGYSVYVQPWNAASSGTVPVMTLYYEGQAQKISATLSGSVKSGLNGSVLGDATVELYAGEELLESTTSASNGKYSFTVDEVDVTAEYTVKASKDGYTAQSTTVDLKAGGAVNVPDLTLPKLAVPATLSGNVINKTTSQPVEGVAISFNGENKESGEDGSYSFSIANVDLLPSDGVTLTASAPGYYDYSTSLRITGDMSFNIELEPLAPLPGDGAQVGEYSITDYSYKSPFNTLEYNCITETIYPKEMLGNLTEGEKYSSITFYGYNPSSTPAPNPDEGDDDDDPYGGYYAPALKAETPSNTFNIAVYMVDTDDSKFTATSEGEGDYSAYTKLYEGPVTISEGGSAKNPVALFTADFVKPYVYGGKNLKLIMVSNCKSYKIIYFCTDPAAKSNVIQKYGNNAELLEAADWRQATDGVPVFKLGDYVPVAEVNGTITDKSSDDALEGVEVTLSYDTNKYTATTDAEGKYTLYVRNVAFDEDYALSVAYLEYNEINEVVSFTEDTMEQTFDFALVQEGEISGVITDAKTDEPVAGATVTLLNGEEVVDTTTSDAAGAYSFTMEEAVYAEFTVKVVAENYAQATLPVQLTAEKAKVDDANFVLNDTESGIEAIFGEGAAQDVVNVSGVVVRRNATADDIKSLPQGLYIIGNKKVVVK